MTHSILPSRSRSIGHDSTKHGDQPNRTVENLSESGISHHGARGWLRALLAPIVLGLLGSSATHAYPPAPHHLIYGTLRNEQGTPLVLGSGAQVILEGPSGLSVPGSLTRRPGGVNYWVEVPMDSGVTAKAYQPTALRPNAPFKISVRIGSEVFVPLEMGGDFSHLGETSGETRIDLTLGIDSDGDGLPDAWEKTLAARSGGRLTLADIQPNDDLDGDGLSNLNEYLAGTYAYDPKNGFQLSLAGVQGTTSFLDFLSIRGREYTLMESTNMRDWVQVPFRLSDDPATAAPRNSLQATRTTQVRALVESPAEGSTERFFRLMVQ